jgi:hypothetical protein
MVAKNRTRKSSLPKEVIEDIRSIKETQSTIAKRHNISQSYVCMIRNKKKIKNL